MAASAVAFVSGRPIQAPVAIERPARRSAAPEAPATAGPSSLGLLCAGAFAGAATGALRSRRARVARRAQCGCGPAEEPTRVTAAEAQQLAMLSPQLASQLEAQQEPVSTNRRSVTGAAAASAAASSVVVVGGGSPAEAKAKLCNECGGEGITDCRLCNSSGQWKMMGSRGLVGLDAKYQYVECPECYGVGQKICETCLGTGLPAKRLQGFLRREEWQEYSAMVKAGKISVENIGEVQNKVQEIIAIEQKNKAERLAKKALQPKEESFFPNFF